MASKITKDLANLTIPCLDYDYETLDEISKDGKSFHIFSKIKPCFEHQDRNRKKNCIFNALLSQNCAKEYGLAKECTNKAGKKMKIPGTCFDELNSMFTCLENELYYLNLTRY